MVINTRVGSDVFKTSSILQGVAMVATCASSAVCEPVLFDFESLPATFVADDVRDVPPGPLSSLQLVADGVGMSIWREDQARFDVSDLDIFSASPGSFGDQALDPFSHSSSFGGSGVGGAFIFAFDAPIESFQIDWGNGVSSETTIEAFTDVSLSELVAVDSGIGGAFPGFGTLSVQGRFSVVRVSNTGTRGGDNLVYLDNVVVSVPSVTVGATLGFGVIAGAGRRRRG